MTKTIKERWNDGGITIGAWASLGSPLAAEILSRSGLDYVCVDNQHGVADYLSTVSMLQAIDCGEASPVVRVPWNEPGIIGKMLDAGAEAVIVPMVNSVAEAEAAVAATRYPPAGARSFGPVRAALRTPAYYEGANDDVACVVMIETVAALAAVDDIVAVPGVDAVYVGPADLSISLGLAPGNPDHESAFTEALATIVAACEHAGVVPGIHATTSLVGRRVGQGFRMVTATADNVAMAVGLAAAVDARQAVVDGDAASADAGSGNDRLY